MDLSVKIHDLTNKFPKNELYGITSQIRRASLSVPANIAEGFGRYSYPDKMHKYVQARGELIEVMTFFHYSQRVGYISFEERDTFLAECQHILKLLNGLISKMNKLDQDRKSTRLNSSHSDRSRMPSSA